MIQRCFTQTYGIAGAIIEDDGKILLIQELGGLDKNKWNQPAGWIEVGENPLDSVKKEVREETGLDFEPTGIVGIYSLYRKDLEDQNITPHPIKIIFRGKIRGETKVDKSEIADLRWFEPREIYAMTSNNLRDIDIKQEVKDYLAGKSYPLEIIHHAIQKKIKMIKVKFGKYRHFKGGEYEVIGCAEHSETGEELVIYKSACGALWARPKKMFLENVDHEGKIQPRFKYIGK